MEPRVGVRKARRIKVKSGELKPAINIQVHADVQMLAGVYLTLRKQGMMIPPKFSTLVNSAIEVMAHAWGRMGLWEDVRTVHEAIQILEINGFNTEQAYKRSPDISLALSVEDRLAEGLDGMSLYASMPVNRQPEVTPEQLAEYQRQGREKAREMGMLVEDDDDPNAPAAPTQEEIDERNRRNREESIAAGLIVPEGARVIVEGQMPEILTPEEDRARQLAFLRKAKEELEKGA